MFTAKFASYINVELTDERSDIYNVPRCEQLADLIEIEVEVRATFDGDKDHVELISMEVFEIAPHGNKIILDESEYTDGMHKLIDEAYDSEILDFEFWQ